MVNADVEDVDGDGMGKRSISRCGVDMVWAYISVGAPGF